MIFGQNPMKMTKNGQLGPPPKNWEFSKFDGFDQKPWTTAHENDQNLWFLKKNFVFEKFENWMGFDQNSLTITHETAKYDKKIEIFHRKPYDVAEP